MRSNVNLLTDASETSTTESNTGYENSTAAHITGDWGVHNQVLFYGTLFAEFGVGHTIANGYLLRLYLTGTNGDGTGDAAFTTPAILTGDAVDSGGAPIIIREPQSLSLFVGQNGSFSVKAISADPMSYQWYGAAASPIVGGTSSTLVLSNVQTTSAGSYYAIVTNSFGTATSSVANLTVTVPTAGVSISQDGCFLPDTFVTMADGTQKQIKDIQIGDKLASFQISGLDPNIEAAWKTWSTTGLALSPDVVTVRDVYIQRFSGYYQLFDLKVTYEHPIMSKRDGVVAFREVQDLRKGDYLWKNGAFIPFETMTPIIGEVITYNLNVEPTDVYIAQGFLVHNNFFKSVWRFITPETALLGAIGNP